MPSKPANSKKNHERAKKPELPRTEPIRSWSTIFGPNGAGMPRSATETPQASTSGGGPADSVRRGVELGYRVLDDYLRQGATAAGAFAAPPRTWAPSPDDLPRMTERMLQYTSDFTSLWFDAMRIMNTNAGAQPRDDGKAGRSSPDRPTEVDRRARWVLEVRSERPAEIIIALDEPVTGELTVEPLRASSGKRVIADVAIRPAAEPGGALRVRVHVPPKLPAGRYTGAVVDAAGQPKGRLTVTLAK